MPACDVDAPAGPQQEREGVERTRAAPDGGGDRRTRHAEFGERPEAEDETGAEKDVDGVGEPEHAHGNRRVARAAEDGVDEKQHDDRGVAAEHHARVVGSLLYHTGRGSHQREQLRGERDAEDGQHYRHADADDERLRGGARSALRVVLARAARDHRRRADAEPDGERVDERQHRLGEPDGGDGVRAEPRDEEHVNHGEDALHHHLKHHRNREQHDGAPD